MLLRILVVVFIVSPILGFDFIDEKNQQRFIDLLDDDNHGERYIRQVSGTRCTTPRNEQGSCIPIRQCEPLMNMIRFQRDDPEARRLLTNSRCGGSSNNPNVCCPQSTNRGGNDPTVPGSNLLDPPSCGVSEVTDGVKIVGGSPADLGAWPWMAALGYSNSTHAGPLWNCGGALISNKFVLTAAHCIKPGRYTLFVVRLGDLILSNNTDGATPIDFGIEKTITHRDYSPTRTDDIALIKLDNTVRFSRFIKPICIPKLPTLKSQRFEALSPFVAGWGAIDYGGPSSDHLLQVQLPVVKNSDCWRVYRQKRVTIVSRQLCAGFMDERKDSCTGDSGGPLMYPDGRNWYVIGVVSFGFKCAEPGYPGVYTRVTDYVEWISDNIE